MTNEEHEKELQNLYKMAYNQDNVEICVDILGQMQHFGYNLPDAPLQAPESPVEA